MAPPGRPPAWAADYIGLPFRDGGRSREGLDCWGLCRLIWAERAGLAVPSFAGAYRTARAGGDVEAAIRTHGTEAREWVEVPAGAERCFDAVLMTAHYTTAERTMGKAAMHVGLVLASGWMIHVERRTGDGGSAALARYRSDPDVAGRVESFWRPLALAEPGWAE